MFRRLIAAGVLGLTALAGLGAAVGTAQAAPGSSAAGHGFSVTLSGLPRHAAIALGGAPLTFTVTVRNLTGSTSFAVSPVIAVDHCGCNSSPVAMAPLGTLREYNAATRSWRTVRYVAIGGGMDFVTVVQQPPFRLLAGQARSFTFRVSFLPQARQLVRLHNGPTAIGVWLMREPVNPMVDATLHPLTSIEAPVRVVVR